MSKDKEKGGGIVGSLGMLKNAITKGAAVSVTERTNDAVYERLANVLAERLDVDREKFNNPAFKEAVLTLVPMVMLPAATVMEDKVPYAGVAKAYAKNSLVASGRRNGELAMDLMGELFKVIYEAQNEPEKTVMKAAAPPKRRIKTKKNYSILKKDRIRILVDEFGLDVKKDATKEEMIEALQEYEVLEESLSGEKKVLTAEAI